MADEPETPKTDPPSEAPALEDAAREQHRVQAGLDQRQRGKVELVIGIALTLLGAAGFWVTGGGMTMFGIIGVGAITAVGVAVALTGAVHIIGHRHAGTATEVILARHRGRVLRGWIEVGAGTLMTLAGVYVMYRLHETPSDKLRDYLFAYFAYVVGFLGIVVGTLRLVNATEGLTKPESSAGTRNDISIGFGFRSFVAWRYLMARHHRLSRIVLAVIFIALFTAGASMMAWYTILRPINPLDLHPDTFNMLVRVVLIAMIAGIALLYFSIIIGLLRFVFSFFTTVPVVGVWIGTAALIIVLSVMSGFETDLRQKILGSNAHIQITAESGDITNWREVKARIDKVPGVLASTPYAVSEVVIAANNNGMNVIIKGIDPETVANVTKLVQSIKDEPKEAMKRLEPLVDDSQDLTVPQPAPGTGPGNAVDPAPDDMPSLGEPIDFSQPRGDVLDDNEPDILDDPPALDLPDPMPPESGSAVGSGSAAAAEPFGGDAEYLVESAPVLDPAPDDLITLDEEPVDYSGSDDVQLPIHVVDVPYEPSVSRRVQSLPGILVGQELVKQTHLYVGEEVRVVSPLSDPSNPDATGTPIPFNRDYRVAGIFFTGMYEYDLKYVYVTLDSLTDFLDRGDVIDGIEVRIGSPDDTDGMVATLQKTLGPTYRVQDWKELNRSLFSALKLEKIAMFLVLGIVILVASFSIVGNLIMVVVEKAREIALLKTLGAADMNVMLVFAIQGLLIGVIGTGLGVFTGLVACWVLKEFGFPLNPDVYYIDQLPVHVDAESVMLTAFAGVMISMLATFYPAVVAARVRPAAGMRH